MRVKKVSPKVILLIAIILFLFSNITQAKAQCNIVWSGDASGSVPTNQTSMTHTATSQAFTAILGFSPVVCVQGPSSSYYYCFDSPLSEVDGDELYVAIEDGLGIWSADGTQDADGIWNVVCNVDTDGDGIFDALDNCPYDAENDTDSDGVCGDVDNCPNVYNSGQEDSDSNGVGNVCEPDACILEWWTDSSECSSCGGLMDYSCDYDCDFIVNGAAVTSETIRSQQAAVEVYQNIFWPQYTPSFQGDCYTFYFFNDWPVEQLRQKICLDGTWTFSESAVDPDFNYSYNSNSNGGWRVSCLSDSDNDGVFDSKDNCPSISNPLQEDADNDSIGDVCDADTIYGAISGVIQAGVTVELYTTSCGGDILEDTTTTNSEGYYAIGDLANGRYLLDANASGYSFSTSYWVDIPQTEMQSYDFTTTWDFNPLSIGIWGAIRLNTVQVYISFNNDGSFFLSDQTPPEPSPGFTYTISGNQITFIDDICGSDEGIYTYSINGNTLSLAEISDPCSRKTILEGDWTKR